MKLIRTRLTNATAVSVIALGLANSAAQATVITFDDLNGQYISVPNGYGGLNWTNWRTLDTVSYPNTPTGYQNSAVSPNNIIWQAADLNGANATGMFSSTPFTLNSFYATAAWRDGLTVTVTAYLNNVLADTAVLTVSTSGPTLEVFNWTNIDQVNVLTSGGTPHAGFPYADYEVALDNVTINESRFETSATPLPSTWLMLLSGFFGLGYLTHRGAKKRTALAAA